MSNKLSCSTAGSASAAFFMYGNSSPTIVNYDGSKYIKKPWERCSSGAECLKWVAEKEEVRYDVTFDILAKYLLGNHRKYSKF